MEYQNHLTRADAQSGAGGFSSLLNGFETELRRVAAGMGLAGADADDVLQEVSLAALRRPGEFRGIDKGRGWLVKVTVNLCTLEYRRRKRFRRKAVEILTRQRAYSEPPTGPETLAVQAEELERLRACLRDMNEVLLAPLALRYFNGLTSEQIGEILGVAAGTVRGRLHEARLILAKRLTEGGDRDGR